MTLPPIDWAHPQPFVLSVMVESSAIDSYQHVNNSVYLRWMDDCARAHSMAVGIDCENAVEFGFGMAVTESRARYLAAAFEGDEVAVGAWVIKNDRRLRITRQFQIVRATDGQALVEGEIDYVCINIDSGKPAKMPNEFKTKYVPIID